MGNDSEEIDTMQLQTYLAKRAAIRAFSTPVRCPRCGDWMVAPVVSEFVEGGEIRHHWECETCGESTTTAIPLTTH
jgi:transcription elongation factor Elf1